MTIDRRQFIGSGAMLGAMAPLGARAAAASDVLNDQLKGYLDPVPRSMHHQGR